MKKLLYLTGLLALLLLGQWLASGRLPPQDLARNARMLDAAERTQAAFAALLQERLARGIALDLGDDPNGTGLIGPRVSGITTTLGSLEAKRSVTNPNVAAMIVSMLEALGLQPGDRIAVNLSGSFPGLNIAVLCAAEALGLEARAIFSVGASTYGATHPEFTYGDMEHCLHAAGLLPQCSLAFSLGGAGDQGLDMDPTIRDAIAARLASWGYSFIFTGDFSENLGLRCALYEAAGPVRCLINVGGNLAAFGPEGGMHNIPGGILTALPAGVGGDGLAQYFLGKGVPMIQLLNMKSLLPEYGLPFDPVPLPEAGQGSVYALKSPSKPIAAFFLGAFLVLLGVYRRVFRPKAW